MCLKLLNLSLQENVRQKVWRPYSICVTLVQGSNVSSAADSADTQADQVSIDKAGLPHDSGGQEGVTPGDPSFSRPAPCLLPEHQQVWPGCALAKSSGFLCVTIAALFVTLESVLAMTMALQL